MLLSFRASPNKGLPKIGLCCSRQPFKILRVPSSRRRLLVLGARIWAIRGPTKTLCLHHRLHKSDAGDATLQSEPAQGEEPQLSPDDLLALAVNFAIEYALPWKGNGTRGNCSVCSKLYSGRDMLRDGHFYVSLPLRQQLASILCTREVAVALRERLNEIDDGCRQSEGDEMGDITDGKDYRVMRQKLEKHDLSLTFNSDGSPLFKSSKYAIWPVVFTRRQVGGSDSAKCAGCAGNRVAAILKAVRPDRRIHPAAVIGDKHSARLSVYAEKLDAGAKQRYTDKVALCGGVDVVILTSEEA
ncbi:hypothetical protein HPB52_019987 [Rhipicephalus sanguineus]|uniref:Uncharacterized protein n=1 Tax=Rhipicephalus sanguineus TaxID=34632 RepID=A0A9D4PDN3_RHISA|nr:hypothetical protein HPB52_019987 [Rhipicephalus sanguineus]